MRPGGKERPQGKEEVEKMEVESTSREEEPQKMAQKQPGEERDKKGVAESERHLPPWKRGRAGAGAAATTLSTGRGEETGLKTDSAHSESALSKVPVSAPSVTVKRPHVSTDSATPTINAPTIKAPPINALTIKAPTINPLTIKAPPINALTVKAPPPRGAVVITVRDSGSSSDSDSGSDSHSSQSSTSSQEKPRPAKLVKVSGLTH